MFSVYLALGSNMGDRHKTIQSALKALKKHGIQVGQVSTLIETNPVGGIPQAKYLNGAAHILTKHPPAHLLKILKQVERQCGRTKGLRYGPRPIDLDILLYQDQKIKTKQLTIPHPEMFKRSFVMNPLKEICSKEILASL